MSFEKPWFLWISFVGPHEPFDTPQPWSLRRQVIEKGYRTNLSRKWIKELPKYCKLARQLEEWRKIKVEVMQELLKETIQIRSKC